LEEIDLSCSLSDLKIFPDLSSLKNLKKLNLSAETVMGQKMPPYELFGQMLDSIKNLEQIEELDISFWKPKKKSDWLVIKDGNVSIPDVFNRFPNLFRLSIANMKIDFVPESILGLTKLRELQIQGNNFDKDEIARIKTNLPKCGVQNY
ncbi:leucine-rich repeat domain-containing protein, partial [Chryseobacterium balustinum]